MKNKLWKINCEKWIVKNELWKINCEKLIVKNKLWNEHTVWMSALQFSTQHFSARRIHSGPAIDKLLYWTKFSHTPKVRSFSKQCLHFARSLFDKKSGKHCFISTRLTWLIHTSVLLSNWNLDKIFAPIGQLAHWSATVMTPLRNIVYWMLSKDL